MKRSTSWGSAAWATAQQIEQAGLLRGSGVILGQTAAGYLRASGDTHTLLVGASRSGKDVSTVIPTLLSWPYSVIVLDPKGDSYDLTARYRHFFDAEGVAHGQVYRVNFASTVSHRVNLWHEIRYGTIYEIDDADRLAEALATPSSSTDEKTEYWRSEAVDVLSTVNLYLGHQDRFPCTGAGAFAFMSQPLLQALKMLQTCGDSIVTDGAQRLLNQPKTDRAKSWAAGVRLLRSWRSPLVAKNTSTMDIPWQDLQQGSEPITVYLQVSMEDLTGRLRRLFRALIEFLLGRLIDRPVQAYQQRVLVLLNEFAAMGHVPSIRKSVALVAGYGIQMLLVLQSLEQLWDAYGRQSGILGNCPVKVIFAQGEEDSAEVFSEMIGEATVSEQSDGLRAERFFPIWQHRSQTVSTHRRRLVTADELRRFPRHQGIVLADGVFPILMDKIYYYRDPSWLARVA